MNTINYTAPTASDLKDKEIKPSYVSKARELLEKVTFERFQPVDPRKYNGSGFKNEIRIR